MLLCNYKYFIKMSAPILTVAIPTYNRETYLDCCLNSFIEQLAGFEEDIEILVSDNASTDSTATVISRFNKIYPITHIVNDENKGPDFNIVQSFTEAKGKYVWVFGDDDFLLPNTLKEIVSILKSDDFGLLHLAAISFSSIENIKYNSSQPFEFTVHLNPLEYYGKISYFVTFITGNIINKSMLNKTRFDEFLDTNLAQLSWVIPSIFGGSKNVTVEKPIVAAKSDNTGGYKLITTFSKNFNIILKSLVKSGLDKSIIRTTNRKLLDDFFPFYINKVLYGSNNFESEKGFFILLSNHWSYTSFWRKILPIYFKFFVKKHLLMRNS